MRPPLRAIFAPILFAIIMAIAPPTAVAQTPSSMPPPHPTSLEERMCDDDAPADSDGAPSHGKATSDPEDSPAVDSSPYRQAFYDNDFTYLNDPDYDLVYTSDLWKRVKVAPETKLDLGGEYRPRMHIAHNLRLNGLSNQFLLERTNLFANLTVSDRLRAFAGFNDATSAFEDLLPRPIDENRADFINLFFDATVWQSCCGESALVRAGRQEIILGSQRLVSNRPWRNVPIFFDGARVIANDSDLQWTGFWTRPIDPLQHLFNDHNFDNPDQSQEFYGAFASYRPDGGREVDAFFLRLAEYDTAFLGAIVIPGGFDANTFGARWKDNWGDVLWEIEGGYQSGRVGSVTRVAGFATVGTGFRFADLPWQPEFWAYWDWASGDSNPNEGPSGTFNQLFPRGHYYLGWADIVGRQNIVDWNLRITATPHKRVTVVGWYHIFRLDEARDALYNPSGFALRFDPSGAAGTDVGNELDCVIRIELHRQMTVDIGYAHLFAGSFLARTGDGEDADFFYSQTAIKF